MTSITGKVSTLVDNMGGMQEGVESENTPLKFICAGRGAVSGKERETEKQPTRNISYQLGNPDYWMDG